MASPPLPSLVSITAPCHFPSKHLSPSLISNPISLCVYGLSAPPVRPLPERWDRSCSACRRLPAALHRAWQAEHLGDQGAKQTGVRSCPAVHNHFRALGTRLRGTPTLRPAGSRAATGDGWGGGLGSGRPGVSAWKVRPAAGPPMARPRSAHSFQTYVPGIAGIH